MSSSKGSKRISVFDRLGPGNDESGAVHRRYSSEKHVSASAGPDKSRGHGYGPSAPPSHIRMEDREAPPIRDRKSRHRSSMGDFPSSAIPDTEILEEKRPPNAPPLKSARDPSETLKSVGVKVARPPGAMGSGESDYDSGEEGKRRKGYRGDHDMARRSKHGDAMEEDASKRGRGKEKVHSHPERPGSSASRHRSPPVDVGAKSRSRREAILAPHDHKRRKEEDPKPLSELGHKRKRDHLEDAHLPDVKRARHADHHGNAGRDVERHHGNSGKDMHGSMDRKWRLESGGSELSSRKQHRSRSPKTPIPVGGGDRERGRVTGKGHKYGSSSRDSAKKSNDKEHSRTSDAAKKSKGLDWSTVNDFTEKANSKLNYHPSKSVLEQFTPAAVLMGVEISPLLTGPHLFHRIVEMIRAHSKTVEEANLMSYWVDILEGPESVTTPRTPVRSALDWDKTISKSLGACRRALTASDDYTLRRLLRKDQHRSFIGPVRAAPNSWTVGHYDIALDFYQTLPTKPSGKPAHRIQASKVGTLVL